MIGFDVIHAKSSVKARNKMDLSAPVLATMDIGQIVPLGTWEMIPGDDFKVGLNAFSRLAPLVEPTYGKVHFKTVKAFVPYHQIAWDSDAWLAGKTSWEGQTPRHRYFTLGDIYSLFTGSGNGFATTTGSTSANCDFCYLNAAGDTTYYYRFTTKGKYLIKLLNALGYAFPQNIDLQSGSWWQTTGRNIKVSAYPLLAFFKLYNDYMSQSQRFNISALSNFLQCVKYGKTVAGFTPSTGALSSAGIKTMFDNLLLNYENDYFTSAWQSPNAALGGVDNITQVNVPANIAQQGDYITHNLNDTLLHMQANAGLVVTPGQRAIDMLRRFDDWVRRNNYSGSRAVQQLYSRFGVKTEDYKSHYAHILGTDDIPIQIGDVTATAATMGNTVTPQIPLGDYAGKGIMSGEIGCSYKSSDYGMLFILGYYTVTPLNAYGFDRSVLRIDPMDYYNPEFDGLGADAIPLMEVFENPRGLVDSDTTTSDSVFGFTERYNSYRYGRPKILGDFRKYQNSDPMNAWHTGRLLGSVRAAGNLVAQSSSVNTLPQYDSEYNRIFSITSGDVDHFYLTCYFDVSAVRPMLNLNQVPNLGEGGTVVSRNGNVIS